MMANGLPDDRHLTKQTISPPFNFMHVTHTAAQQLPALDTVEEKDLPGEFWSVSAYQRPRRHLHGIKADNLPKKRQPSESSPISPISPSSRPISPIAESELDSQPIGRARIGSIENISPIDETMFDEISQTRFDPDAGALSLQPAKQVLKYPKRYSSLTALNQRSQADSRGVAQGDAQAANMNTFYESNSSVASGDAGSRTVSPNIQRDPPDPNTDIQKSAEMQRDFEPKQALPALPDKKPSSNQFKDVKKSTSTSNMSLIMPQPTSPRSKRSSRSLRSTMKSPTFSSHSDFRNSMTFSDYASWEDDVDFSYEQAAESTCDFNWDIISRPREDSTQTLDTGLSVSSYHAYSPAVSNDSSSSLRFNGMNASSETIAERRRSRVAASPGHHKRGSSVASVGHRGFLAARKSSTDLTAMAQQPNPTPLQISPNLDNSAQVNVLSPVFSVTGADDEQEKSPFTPDAIHYPRFDSVITENLSDPESCRNSGSSKHRKSSSYGSHESTARPQPNPAKESNRWSVASVSSLPDLLHPRTKKTHLSKTIISSPLEALPQSPPSETDTVAKRESRIIPAEFQNQTNRNSFVMRRPQTSGDRAAMQAAGRMVQRRGARPATPQRMSRIIQTPDGMAVPEAEKTGPKWI